MENPTTNINVPITGKQSSAAQVRPPIRFFTPSDLDAVCAMAKELFPVNYETDPDELKELLRRLYLENPINVNGISSLVYEGPKGSIDGFLGVIKRPMLWNGKRIIAALSNHLMLKNSERSTLASVALIKAMMQGEHDFCFTDSSSDTSRFLWERCGGSTAWAYSMHYRHMVKPFSFVRNRITNKSLMAAYYPVRKAGDFIANHTPGSPFNFKEPAGKIEEIHTGELLILMDEMYKSVSVKPVYTIETLNWLLETMQIEQRKGEYKLIKIINRRGTTAGWVFYHQKLNGMCQIIQFEAKNGMQDFVFQALCYHAFKGGGVELEGRLDPRYFKRFGNKSTIFVPGRLWTLIHSKNQELMLDLQTGKAALSKLEGDMWLV